MKKSFLITCTGFLIAINCFSQSVDKTNYLQKSKTKKTTAWVLLGAGAALDIAGLLAYPKHYNGWGNTAERNRNVPSIVLLTAGTVSMIVSIPFFVKAHAYKQKAANLTIDMQQYRQLRNSSIYAVNYPALTLKIRL